MKALALVAALVLSGCAAFTAGPQVPAEVREALAKANVPESALGIVAFPLHDRSQVMRLNADRPMPPASTMKLLTAIVALDKLGPNAKGRTDLLIADKPVGDVLPGPVYLRGGADSDLSWGALWQMLHDLRESGVREIQGGLVVDRTLFRPARLDIGVPPFDSEPESYYNVIPDALLLNGNLISFKLKAESTGGVKGAITPAWPGIEVDGSAMTVNERPCKDWEKDWKTPTVLLSPDEKTHRVQLQGSFPRSCEKAEVFNVIDRQWLTAQVVRQIWRELGGVMAGQPNTDREAATPAGAQIISTHQSAPLGETLRGIMKRSDNALTRLTFLRLGAAAAAPDEMTLTASERVVREWFKAKGLDDSGLVLDNGSGLSRSERIKPSQLAGMLTVAWDGRMSAELLGTLPVAGYDGTLRNRMKGTAAEGRARMKTGTLHDTVALAGYVPDSQNRPWVVVGMVNIEQAGRGRAALDALAAWVAKQ